MALLSLAIAVTLTRLARRPGNSPTRTIGRLWRGTPPCAVRATSDPVRPPHDSPQPTRQSGSRPYVSGEPWGAREHPPGHPVFTPTGSRLICEEFTARRVNSSLHLDNRRAFPRAPLRPAPGPLALLAVYAVPHRHSPDSIKGAHPVRVDALDEGPQSALTNRLWGSCPAGRRPCPGLDRPPEPRTCAPEGCSPRGPRCRSR